MRKWTQLSDTPQNSTEDAVRRNGYLSVNDINRKIFRPLFGKCWEVRQEESTKD